MKKQYHILIFAIFHFIQLAFFILTLMISGRIFADGDSFIIVSIFIIIALILFIPFMLQIAFSIFTYIKTSKAFSPNLMITYMILEPINNALLTLLWPMNFAIATDARSPANVILMGLSCLLLSVFTNGIMFVLSIVLGVRYNKNH